MDGRAVPSDEHEDCLWQWVRSYRQVVDAKVYDRCYGVDYSTDLWDTGLTTMQNRRIKTLPHLLQENRRQVTRMKDEGGRRARLVSPFVISVYPTLARSYALPSCTWHTYHISSLSITLSLLPLSC